MKYTKKELSAQIADEGGWEEFHQKKKNFTMYDHHKDRRRMLEKMYRYREYIKENLYKDQPLMIYINKEN